MYTRSVASWKPAERRCDSVFIAYQPGDWKSKPASKGTLVARIQPRRLSGGISLIELSGGPFNCGTQSAEIARDEDEYLGSLHSALRIDFVTE